VQRLNVEMNELFVKNEAVTEKYATAIEENARLKKSSEKLSKQKQICEDEMRLRAKVILFCPLLPIISFLADRIEFHFCCFVKGISATGPNI
jgi:hypothetical protein